MRSLSWARLSDFPFTFHFHALEKDNGNPLQYSSLENPRDRGAWWAAVSGVAQSRTNRSDLAAANWQATVHGVTKSQTAEQLHFKLPGRGLAGFQGAVA